MPKKKAAETREIEALAERMLRVLEEFRRLGGDAYPVTFRELAERCDLRASDQRVAQAANKQLFKDRAVVGRRRGNKPNLDCPVVLREDIEADTVFPTFLQFAVQGSLRTAKGEEAKTHAWTPAVLSKKVPSAVQKSFQTTLERRIADQTLPPGYAWICIDNRPRLFLLDKIWPESLRPVVAGRNPSQPSGPSTHSSPDPNGAVTPRRPFADAFHEAFRDLDRRNDSTNFVKLSDLRRALPDFDREQFDAGLRELRLAKVYSLDSHEGLHGALTAEEREAGIREGGSVLVYVSRR